MMTTHFQDQIIDLRCFETPRSKLLVLTPDCTESTRCLILKIVIQTRKSLMNDKTGESAETLKILRQMTESDFHDLLSGQSPPEDFKNTFSNQKDEK